MPGLSRRLLAEDCAEAGALVGERLELERGDRPHGRDDPASRKPGGRFARRADDEDVVAARDPDSAGRAVAERFASQCHDARVAE